MKTGVNSIQQKCIGIGGHLGGHFGAVRRGHELARGRRVPLHDRSPEGRAQQLVGDSKVAHSGEGAPYPPDPRPLHSPRGPGRPDAARHPVQHIGALVVTGLDLKVLAVAQKQVAHVLHAVDSVVEHHLGRVLFGAELEGGRGVEDDDGQCGCGQRLRRLERRRVRQVQGDNGIHPGLLERGNRFRELVFEPAHGHGRHLQPALLEFAGNGGVEVLDARPRSRRRPVIEFHIQRKQSNLQYSHSPLLQQFARA